MNTMANSPIWVVVLGCGALMQLLKFGLYSVANRQFALSALGQSYGLPSLPTAVLGCLLVMTVARTGWKSSETGFVLVFAVVAIHDAIKLRVAASRQREVLHRLVTSLPDVGPFHQRVADYLDPRAHNPAHVLLGGVLGTLFALAFGMGAG